MSGARRTGASARRFDAVVFDMDGVLVDSEPMHVEAMRRVLSPLGITYSDADNERFFGFTDPEVFRALAAERARAIDERRLVRERTALIVRLTGERTVRMDGVPDVLHRVRAAGYRLALASASAPDIIDATLDAIDARGVFDVVVSGMTVGRGKPAPDIFLETAKQLAVAPGRCVVVEDSRNGLLAAKAAGMACVAIPCPATRHERFDEADWELATLRDLGPILSIRGE